MLNEESMILAEDQMPGMFKKGENKPQVVKVSGGEFCSETINRVPKIVQRSGKKVQKSAEKQFVVTGDFRSN